MMEKGKMKRGVVELVDTESLVPQEHLLRVGQAGEIDRPALSVAVGGHLDLPVVLDQHLRALQGVSAAIRGFLWNGGGLIGVGEPSGHQYQGRYFQLAGALGVEKETGFTLGYDNSSSAPPRPWRSRGWCP